MSHKPMNYGALNKRAQYWRAVRKESGQWERPHLFKMFRTGEDICGVCGKSRAEHRTASTRSEEP